MPGPSDAAVIALAFGGDDADESWPERGREPVRMLTTMQAFALVVLAVALTFFVTVWFTRDDPGSFNEVDVGFLADMTTHHQGAISLGFAYLPVENDSIVGHTAREVILAQTTEISTMNRLIGDAGDDADPIQQDGVAMEWMGEPVAPKDMPGLATNAEYEQLRAARGVDADDIFTRLMINHHAAGAEMSDYAAEFGENDSVRGFAEKIARIQRIEIIELNDRRELLGLAPIDVDTTSGHRGHQ